jgi:hypothetical protein
VESPLFSTIFNQKQNPRPTFKIPQTISSKEIFIIFLEFKESSSILNFNVSSKIQSFLGLGIRKWNCKFSEFSFWIMIWKFSTRDLFVLEGFFFNSYF